ncbi:hypothetical protein AB0N05_04935 [Nocardia sp. NPDC051030]|uniref:hypothetical protein n=1 Tax=Nocardia sp. NPDC051030 TaxID=3155162 RepID=UPI0034495432
MQHFHRSSSNSRGRRLAITVAQLVGATAAATIAAGPAAAESLSRGEGSTGRPGASSPNSPTTNSTGPNYTGPNSTGGFSNLDPTGAHHTDPFGYHHTDTNPLMQNEHTNNLRDSRTPQQQPAPRTAGDGGSPASWTPIDSSDGTGWAVCRPQASWC